MAADMTIVLNVFSAPHRHIQQLHSAACCGHRAHCHVQVTIFPHSCALGHYAFLLSRSISLHLNCMCCNCLPSKPTKLFTCRAVGDHLPRSHCSVSFALGMQGLCLALFSLFCARHSESVIDPCPLLLEQCMQEMSDDSMYVSVAAGSGRPVCMG